MDWLQKTVDEILVKQPEGEVVVSSGVSPSGTYHIGTLREVLTAEAVMYEVKRRGRLARHLHVVDDLDIFRKVPVNVPQAYSQYLGKPLCDVPSPDGSSGSYADFYLQDLLIAADKLHLEMEIVRANEKYRSGFFTSTIEQVIEKRDTIKTILETVSGHKLGTDWSPMQVMEDGYLKNREIKSIDTKTKTLVYLDNSGKERTVPYNKGGVKLNWRIDWPARWMLLHVSAEPFGRDHATKGGSYDTGAKIAKDVFDIAAPFPIPYNFINQTGETKKMSKSSGDVITAKELLEVLPAEVVWYFILRYPPEKQLFFDQEDTLIKLIDEFGLLLAKPDKTKAEHELIEISLHGVSEPTISSIPFSLLIASYQAALKDEEKTLEILLRTPYAEIVKNSASTIKAELVFIREWLDRWAPESVKFNLLVTVDASKFSEKQKEFLQKLASKIAASPENTDGEWFHKAIYDLRTDAKEAPKVLFSTVYQALIGKDTGPRAGWFLSILPREWLIKRFRLET